MPPVVHSRRLPAGMRYREWDPERSMYVTPELSQPLIREHLLRTGLTVDEVDTMLRRALVSGTSDPASKHDADKAWETEKAPA